MPTPKFKVGDRVAVTADRLNAVLRPGIYTITRSLPHSSTGFQYHVRNDGDAHERVLDEGVLRVI